MNDKNHRTIELASFTLAEGVEEETLMAVSDALNADFLSRQPGFLKRDLVKVADRQWADVIYWESRESVEQAMQHATQNPAALQYFQLMANTGESDPSAEPMLMSVVRSYS